MLERLTLIGKTCAFRRSVEVAPISGIVSFTALFVRVSRIMKNVWREGKWEEVREKAGSKKAERGERLSE